MSCLSDDDRPVSEEICKEKHKRVDEKLDCYEKDIKSIKQKIDAALVFTIVTLVTVIIEILRGGLHV